MLNRVSSIYPDTKLGINYKSKFEHSRNCDSSYLKFGSLLSKRNKAFSRDVNTKDKVKACIGSIIGSSLALVLMMKNQRARNIFKLKYDIQDMITFSSLSIAGGVLSGMIGEDKNTNRNKLKEGIFQTLNAAIPPWVVAGGIKLCEASHNFNNIPGKIMALIAGLVVGMYGSASVSNLICDPHDKAPDRKLNLKDGIANIDDALGVFVLAKFPLADKLHLEHFLPLIYTYCGYRAGKSN